MSLSVGVHDNILVGGAGSYGWNGRSDFQQLSHRFSWYFGIFWGTPFNPCPLFLKAIHPWKYLPTEKSRTLWVNAHVILSEDTVPENGWTWTWINYHICSKFFPYQNGPFRVNSISGQTRWYCFWYISIVSQKLCLIYYYNLLHIYDILYNYVQPLLPLLSWCW